MLKANLPNSEIIAADVRHVDPVDQGRHHRRRSAATPGILDTLNRKPLRRCS